MKLSPLPEGQWRMASKVPDSVVSSAERVPGPPVIDSSLEGLKRWQLERKITQNFYSRGSRYPPFSIEPMPYSVQRTAKLMTDEERFLRKQWLQDQILAPNEPRYVEGAKPFNPIRRFYKAPWDAIEMKLRTVMSPNKAEFIRKTVPRLMIAYGVLLFGYYQMRFNNSNWEKPTGVYIIGARRKRLGGPEDALIPPEPKFGDARFAERTFRNPIE